jgi:hypothetical protein
LRKEVIPMTFDINPSSSMTIKERLKDFGTITQINMLFYSGPQGDLQLRPVVIHKGKQTDDFFTYPKGTEPYISGDNIFFEFPVSLDVENDDELVLYAENKDANNVYTVVCHVIIEYIGEGR